jgi:hypothetical protein
MLCDPVLVVDPALDGEERLEDFLCLSMRGLTKSHPERFTVE